MHNTIAQQLLTVATSCPCIPISLPSALLPHFLSWAGCSMVQNISLASLGHLSWLCSLMAFLFSSPHCQSMTQKKKSLT